MKRKLLLTCAAILVIAMITVPVMAASPVTAANPLDQILSFVKDYKTKLDTILTKLTSLQTDVTTIKTTTDTINGKLNAPPNPIRYEYYTAPMETRTPGVLYYGLAYLTNWGDSPADACWYMYYSQGPVVYLQVKNSGCFSITPGSRMECAPVLVSSYPSVYSYKFTTNSKYVTPWVAMINASQTNMEILDLYLPGDFQKVEIYS